jgi:hypothetical protein
MSLNAIEINTVESGSQTVKPQLRLVCTDAKLISNTQKTSLEFNLIKATLLQNHPELFRNKTRPLAHDIREQILDVYSEFNSKAVLRFLRYIFSTARYLEAIALNVKRVRYNLDLTISYISANNPSFISTEQRKTAANHLAGQLNNYRKPKGLKQFSTKKRKAYFDSLESLDHRFDTNTYFFEHAEFDRFLTEQANTAKQKECPTNNLWPDNF